MRVRTAAVAAAAVGALLLTGCSGGQSVGSSDTLTWSMWIGSSEDQKVWDGVGGTGAEASGKKVSLQGSPFNDYWTKISTQLGTDSAPCIVTMQSLRVNQFSDGLLPLDDLVKSTGFDSDAFDEGAMKALAVDGEQYAIPYDTGPLLLFYNKDAFGDAGVAAPAPGWTVDDFEAAATALKKKGKTALATTVEDIFLEALVFAHDGGQMVDDSGGITLDNAKNAEAVEWIAGLVKNATATRADGADASADDNAFINGTAATVVGGPWNSLDFKAKATFEVGVTTLPSPKGAQKTYAAGSGFGISKTCSDPEGAFAAITAMTSEKTLTSLAQDGRAFPARTAAQAAWYKNAGIDGAEETLNSALAIAVPLPGSADGDKLNQLLSQYGPQMVNGEKPAKDVLAEISSQLGK
ncbi:ABC transporter substrate-binding protein [Streptomyces corynorhini]|uniref:Sugar ABC transporter substrate-binding protein n=1 Tax=Streptomyces corynorhini TaxID=2282652 RepID=A0A370B874_9ACTN|nr:sugar ABC transporter substrate-binding protein [Streptomyces corynorhini]RDG37811.1 sugar ABC transporter substrate-binding protein [Streptomyces corynorhini]